MTALSDRFEGTLLGLAAGDALGTTLEFRPPGTFTPIHDLEGGGPFNLKAGQWTDDTSMALCLAKSLLEKKGFDADDQMTKYLDWYENGYMSSTGECFDIGNTTRVALMAFRESGLAFAGSTDPYSAGNGSIMRLAPVVLFYAKDPEKAMHFAAESSRTTHGAAQSVDACVLMAAYLLEALHTDNKDDVLVLKNMGATLDKFRPSLHEEVRQIREGSFRKKEPPQIQGSGYVVKSLEAALWAFERASNFRKAALLSVNLGDDADTTGAVLGQIGGAFYGKAGIPKTWLDKLWEGNMISRTALALYAHMAE